MDERNFRSAYYEKVGCRSVEEKKSLEILLKDKPINKTKLKQFCLRFTVPHCHRSLLWKLLLGVFPTFTDSYEYVLSQRKAVYEDLLNALEIMRIIDEKTQKKRVFYAMWLLENKKLYLGSNIYGDSNFVTITETLIETFKCDAETYWIAKGFYDLISEIEKDLPKLIEYTFALLEKEDAQLYKHLVKINVLDSLPLHRWYTCCFAGILSDSSIIRVWDKICGGSIKILVFVQIIIFTTLRRNILRCNDIKSLQDVIDNLKDEQETADVLVNKAIELWQQNKGFELK